MPDRDWWQVLWPDPSGTVRLIGVEPGMLVIDLCCGDGLFTAPMAQIAEAVVAIDIDPQMLERTEARLSATGAVKSTLIAGDAYDVVDLVSAKADMVVMANTFHGVPDKARLCSAVATALKPGGRFAVINWHRRPREDTTVLGLPRGPKTELRMEPEEVVAIATPAGFSLERTIELPPYHYAVVLRSAGLLPATDGGGHER